MSETIINQGTEQTESTTANPNILPEQPLVIIEPGRGFGGAWLREVWAYRELLLFLAWRDIRVRYKQTALGVVWVVMQPLLMTLIFSVFLGILARVPSDGLPYPVMVFAGLLPWTFFSNAVSQGGSSIVGNANLITKVYFPRLIIPTAAVTARLIDFAVAFIILFGLMAFYGVHPTRHMAMIPLLVLITALLAIGCATFVAALNVRYRDVGVILPVLMQLWMFASPVLYPSRLVSGAWPNAYRVYELNPIVGIVNGFRAALAGQPFEWPALAQTTAIAVIILIVSAYFFRRVERGFADVI
ncbi:MAG TPA: ABC transporter permease [Pyrinomonadaceae bacterium]